MIDRETEKLKFAQWTLGHRVDRGFLDCRKLSAGEEGLWDQLNKRSKEIAALLFPA